MVRLNETLVGVGKDHLQFSNKDYEQLKELRMILGPFKEATLRTEGDKVGCGKVR